MAPRPLSYGLLEYNFPLYAIDMLSSRHMLIGGGGGSSKTGIANGFGIYEISYNGSHFAAQEVIRYDTGANVVMNLAIRNDGRRALVCVGQESHCQMYIINSRIISDDGKEEIYPNITTSIISSSNSSSAAGGEHTTKKSVNYNNENGVRIRHTNSSNNSKNQHHVEELSNGYVANAIVDNDKEQQQQTPSTVLTGDLKRHLKFDVKTNDAVQTDFLNCEPLQRVVRISNNGHFMATGGTDGHLRIWSFPQMLQLQDLQAHSKEIDDIDISPDSKYIVTVAKDGLGIVWDIDSSKKHYTLLWETPEDVKYLFKRCRYATIESQLDQYRLYCLANPLKQRAKHNAYLQQWDCKMGHLTLSTAMEADEALSSMAVRDDGRFVAIGTMSGNVAIYIAYSLQRVLHIKQAHSTFVTGLQFLPVTNNDGPPISSDTEVAVLSISADKIVCINRLPRRHVMPAWLAIILIVLVLFAAFTLCSYLGL